MGKKRPQKTKELSVAIAEASSTGDETRQLPSQPQTPRKRGRPRKIVEKTESKEKQEQPAAAEAEAEAEGRESSLKRDKISEGEEEEQQPEGSTACIGFTKEEGVSQDTQLPKGEPSRSRARRKSKPRKST